MMDLKRILEIGGALSSEQDYPKLLDMILHEAMRTTKADAGTIYIADDDGKLKFFILRNNTLKMQQGGKGEAVSFPPVPMEENFICAYVALHNTPVHIDDIYTDDRFDFSGARNYDAMTGYTTRSMLVFPLQDNEKNVIGVLQLLNATDEDGNLIPFEQSDLDVINLLSSFSAVSISSMQHSWEMKRQMFSFFNVIISAIDARTPYNASHTDRIVKMLITVIHFMQENPWTQEIVGDLYSNREENMIICAWLHDIGKLFIPLSIMNKATRLGDKDRVIARRFEKIQMLTRIGLLQGDISQEEYDEIYKSLDNATELINRLNRAPGITDDDRNKINAIGSRTFMDWDGQVRSWLDDTEMECLMIPHGTLTKEERKIMEQHASMTTSLLSKMQFSAAYGDAMQWAGLHHEKLNGSGYPDGLKASDLPVEVRLLTVLDILEALTTDERPYKKALSPEKSFEILYDMADTGELDRDIIKIVEASRAWENPSDLEILKRDRAIEIVNID